MMKSTSPLNSCHPSPTSNPPIRPPMCATGSLRPQPRRSPSSQAAFAPALAINLNRVTTPAGACSIRQWLLAAVIGAASSAWVLLDGWTTGAIAQTFVGDSSGLWGTPNVDGLASPQFSGVGTSEFTWGLPFSEEFGANQLVFSGSSFTVESDEPFVLGDLTYFNGTILSETEVNTVALDLALTFTAPMALEQVFTIDFDIKTTPNFGLSPNDDADIVLPQFEVGETTFTIAGEEYTLGLLGFSQDSGITITEEFRVFEDAFTSASLFGQLILPTPDPVPEPVPDPIDNPIDNPINDPTSDTPNASVPEPRAIASLAVLGVVLIRYRKSG